MLIAKDPQWTEKYKNFQGKYPVLYLSFKDVKSNNIESIKENMAAAIFSAYEDHEYFQHTIFKKEYLGIFNDLNYLT